MNGQEFESIEASSASGDRDLPLQYAPGRTGLGAPGSEHRWLRKVLDFIDFPPVCLALWDGQEVAPSTAPPVARLVVRDRDALLRLITNPDLQFGELYSAGRIDVEGSLLEVVEALYLARPSTVPGGVRRTVLNWVNRPRPNSLAHARQNIHHHYDIGNDFYRLWLDEQMVYTCAYFPDRTMTLEQAQVAKMEHVCRKIRLKAGDRVVEAGCGWGALALHMARHHGARVKAYNISREQLAYAREQAKHQGLDDRVEFMEGDFREIAGTYDAFVSVGMLEHVGIAHYGSLGEVIDRCLTANGRGLIHSIGMNRPAALNPWIERRIFPGACPPSPGQLMRIFEPFNFSVLDMENLRLHYARTLEHWRNRYTAVEPQVEKMFDPSFVRLWRLYLTGSQAAFSTGQLQLFQVAFARYRNNDVPWTRDHLYCQDEVRDRTDGAM